MKLQPAKFYNYTGNTLINILYTILFYFISLILCMMRT